MYRLKSDNLQSSGISMTPAKSKDERKRRRNAEFSGVEAEEWLESFL
jgi:hypothetical protein